MGDYKLLVTQFQKKNLENASLLGSSVLIQASVDKWQRRLLKTVTKMRLFSSLVLAFLGVLVRMIRFQV